MDIFKSAVLSLVVIASTPSTTEYIAEPIDDIITVQQEELTMPQLVEIYADKWGVNADELKNTVKCESGFNPNAYNGNDVHKYSVGSLGIAQFSQQTFEHYARKMGKEYSNPYNPDEALDVMAYMFSLGESGKKHWSCWSKFYA